MNQKWDEIKERLSKLSLPQENIEPLTFLPPAEWHVERCKKREVLGCVHISASTIRAK